MEYGLAFADRYARGRFQLPSANMISIVASLKELLVRELDVTLTDDENKDDERAYAKIRQHFETPFLADANHHTLLIFDNVEEPYQTFSLTNIRQWIPQGVHVLLTTRQQVESDPNGLLTGQFVGELSEGASVRLLGSYRPFGTEADKQTATTIAQRLGGYALALNVAGVFLSNTVGYPYAKLLRGLEQDDVRMLDMMGLELEDAETAKYIVMEVLL